jgi:hypothetical protein
MEYGHGQDGLDRLYGRDGDGKQTVAFNLRGVPQDDGAYAMALDLSGRIVLAGGAQYSGSDYDMAVARLLSS